MQPAINYKDFTLKAVVTDFKKIEALLSILNATFIGIDHQKDTYFEVPIGKLKLRQGTIENLITHYERKSEDNLERTTVYQYDLNPTQESIANLFHKRTVIGIVEKERKIYFLENIKIHLDTTPDNKTYIEIEAIDRGDFFSKEDLRLLCVRLKEKLKIDDCDLIKTGYLMEKS